ncbi:MAG: hypothetical protein KAH05_02810, partial [Clostridiales bacterium]|nr:hypothetical protein [Clostridiales bacterium]
MSDIFCNVLDISMKASIAIVIVMLFRFVLKGRMKSAFVYMMWGIVLFRLLVPVNIESVYSVFNVVSVPETAVGFNIEPYVRPTESVDMINQINGNEIAIIEETPMGDIFSKIWSAGVMIFILWFAVVFTRFKNRLVCGERFMKYRGKYDVHVCSGIGSPMISGIVRPRILIPDDLTLNGVELSYILDHEVMHIRRRDYLLKPLTLMAVCIHWFNPLVWIGYFIAMKDMELSCDERVLESYDDESYPMYADTLLKISMHQNNMRLSAMVAFGENNVKSRVVSALKFKKLSRTVKIIGILMILVLSIVLITNGNTESRILKSLNEGFSLRTSQEITKNDIFHIV